MDVGAVGADAVGDRLQQHRLAGLRRRNDQTALPAANRRHQIEQPGGEDVWRRFEVDQLQGKDRGQRVERWAPARRLRIDAIDGLDAQQAEELLVVLRRAHLAADPVAGAQTEAADLRLRDVDVVRAGQESRAAQEAEPILDDLEDAVAEDLPVFLRLSAQQPHHLFLLRQAAERRNLKLSGHLGQFLGRLGLQLGDGDMGWTGSRGSSRRGVWRRRSAAVTDRIQPAGHRDRLQLPAVPAIPGKALGAIGALAWCQGRGPRSRLPRLSRVRFRWLMSASAVAGRFDRSVDCRGFPGCGGYLTGPPPSRRRQAEARQPELRRPDLDLR